MRTLSATLLAAQKQATHTSFVKLEAKNKVSGVVRLDWSRLYTGGEADYFHAVTMPDDGSIVRVRLGTTSDGLKLYRQRVPDPGPSSDFSAWTYTGYYDCIAVAAASLGAEVSIFWINGSQEVRRIKSTDYGVTWGSAELLDYTPSSVVNGIAAEYKPNGDLAIFFVDQGLVFVKKRVGGLWQAKSAWDKSTGTLSGVATVYSGDWNLVVSGKDSSDNYKLWSLAYGDGGDVAAGTWSALKEMASAPSDGAFEYHRPYIDKPDVYRCFYIEKFTGTSSYNRPFWTHSFPEGRFLDSLWREPVPFNLSSEYGLTMAHHGDYAWLSCANGIWRAPLAVQTLDLTADVLSARVELGKGRGRMAADLRNDDGRYTSLPAPLGIGCDLEFSPGYVTPAGNEVSIGLVFALEACEHTSSGSKASLVLHASDGWRQLDLWRARHQFRWNRTSSEANVKDILGFVLARAGLKLEVKSQSSVITGFYPDFTIQPGDSGHDAVNRLLSFVPDVLFVEGSKACLVNPQSSDSSVYSYGTSHPLLEGRYLTGAWETNRVQVEGYDPVSGPIIVDSFSWAEIGRVYDRFQGITDRNVDSVARAGERGAAHLRDAEMESAGGSIVVPVNCGQQLYDVVDITDVRAGMSAAKKRVLGLSLTYSPHRGEYVHRLAFGKV